MSATRIPVLFLIKPGAMSAAAIRRAERLTGICIVECKEPEMVRLVEPAPPADIGEQARAALSMFRTILGEQTASYTAYSKETLMKRFLNALMQEPSPKPALKVEKVKS